MVEYINISSLITSLALGAATFVAGCLVNKVRKFHEEHEEIVNMIAKIDALLEEHQKLMKSQRNQIKNSIIRICKEAERDGAIDQEQLEGMCRLYESYRDLGGNSYIGERVGRAMDLPIIPSDLEYEILIPNLKGASNG